MKAFLLIATALSIVAAQDVVLTKVVPESPRASFEKMSERNSVYTSGKSIGSILGFAVFGIAFIAAVGMIFYDI